MQTEMNDNNTFHITISVDEARALGIDLDADEDLRESQAANDLLTVIDKAQAIPFGGDGDGFVVIRIKAHL